jgi:arginine decarboxylase
MSILGSGKWKGSTGDKSKFGMSSEEIIVVVYKLSNNKMLHCLRLLHYHIGSQIIHIGSIKNAVKEAARLYCNLRKIGCLSLKYLDIGGGLAVDYDGTKEYFFSSRNYSTREYSDNVISMIQNVCDESAEPHPTVITESGRYLTAPHLVLIFNVIRIYDRSKSSKYEISVREPTSEDHYVLHLMWNTFVSISRKNFQESYNSSLALRKACNELFNNGLVDLYVRSKVTHIFWKICSKLRSLVRLISYLPKELKELQNLLVNIYYCNFSVFQSLPDSWALSHLFPVMPIHRLNEKPSKKAYVADLTCDSDGKISKFIGYKDKITTLPLHINNDETYFLGVFLVGAYQEILGNFHNLLGRVNTIHISVTTDHSYRIDNIISGDTIIDMLMYVKYNPKKLVYKIRNLVEEAFLNKRISFRESIKLVKIYKNALVGYTYLDSQ